MRTVWIIVATGLLALAGMASAATGGWGDDFEAARKQAQKSGHPILADFTGSDWCGWCIKLDKEVFQQKAFQDYARSNLVLFVADYPRRKQLPPRVARQNEALMEKYQVQGFPTIFLMDADGKVLGRTGYLPGGATAYVPHLQELLEKSGWKPAAAGEGAKTNGVPPARAAVGK
jgi:thioredoxin-related protein